MHPLRPLTASPRLITLLDLAESEHTMTLIDNVVRSQTTPSDDGIVDVAADVGNGQTVVIVDGAPVVMPSAVSLIGASSYRLFTSRRLPRDSWATLGKDEHIFQWQDSEAETFVGTLALTHGEASTARGSDQRYVDGWTLPLILSAIASAHPRENALTIRLSTGVPAKLWGQIAPDVEKRLKGVYRFRYNGRDAVITIKDVIVEQEGAAVVNILPDALRRGKLILVDIGERTTNVALAVDGEARKATTKEIGVGSVFDDLDDALLGRGWRPLSSVERGELRSALIADEAYSYTVDNTPQRIDKIARSLFQAGAAALVRELRAVSPVDQADHLAVVGGGVYFFGPSLDGVLPHLWMPQKDTEMLTARAYAERLGMTPKKGKARR